MINFLKKIFLDDTVLFIAFAIFIILYYIVYVMFVF